jgi:RNA polymerase sigma-70 factor (ECF subfamily)
MVDTSASLLERVRARRDDDSWQRLVGLYTPLLRGWLRGYGLQTSDVDDLVQDVLAVVVRELPQFQYNQRPGGFRRWLRTIAVHRLQHFWRARQARPRTTDDGGLACALDHLVDPDNDLDRRWDEEHDRHVLLRLLALIEPEFRASTWQAFRQVALEGRDEVVVAAELGMSVHAVFVAKSRVLCRLRREGAGLID